MALPSGTYAPRDLAGVRFRAVQRHLRTWAQTRRLGDARSGAIIVVQRFGGALNLNVHLHALVLDGVFARAGDGQLRFHRAPAPSAADVADVLAAIAPTVRARCARAGMEDQDGAGSGAGAEDGSAGLAAAVGPGCAGDGTTHVAFEPTAFLERLAVLVPRPRINLLLYVDMRVRATRPERLGHDNRTTPGSPQFAQTPLASGLPSLRIV